MRSLFGLVLLMAGLGLGAYAYYPEAAEEHVRLVQLARYMMPVAHDGDHEPANPLRTFSPNSPLFGHGDASHAAPENAASDSPPVVLARRYLVRPASGADAVIPAFSDASPIYAAQPSPRALAARALDVQQELKRVGCYHGYLDGDWGPGSRRAMQAFLDKVNATLPVDQPDDILLALLRSHADDSCTKDCAPGQIQNDSGQCMSNAIYASTATDKRDAAPVLITPPRLANKETGPAEAHRARPAIFPPVSDDADALDPAPVSRAREVLPGRMSVGGPLMAQPSAGAAETQVSALPDLRPAPKDNEDGIETAAITPAKSATGESAEREARRPAKTTKKRHTSRKRYSHKTRQKRLMRQAFGDIF